MAGYYLAECYLARCGSEALASVAGEARVAVDGLRREGVPIRLLRGIVVPEDEMCFLLFEGASGEAVSEACRRAAITAERISEALSVDGDGKER